MAKLAARGIGYQGTGESFEAGGGGEQIGVAGLSDRAKVAKYLRWFRDSARATERWRSNAIESLQFINGQQWSDADLQSLKDQGDRPHVTINRVLSPILFLAGVARQQRTDATLLPFESDDVRGAELMTYLLKWINSACHADQVDDQVFLDKIVAGLGYWKVRLDFDKDPAGQPVWERAHPLTVFPDPNWLDQGWNAANYVIQATWVDREQARDEHPQYADTIDTSYGEWIADNGVTHAFTQGAGETAGDSLSAQRLFWDADNQRVRRLEVWYKRRLEMTVAIQTQTGQVEGDPARVKFMQQMVRQQGLPNIQFVKRPVTTVHRALLMFDLLLEDEPSPYDAAELPIFPTRAFYFWEYPTSLVDHMKDPQREVNRRRSTMIEMVQKMPIGGWLNKREGGAKQDDIRDFAAGVGSAIPYEQTPPIQIRSPEMPPTLLYLDKQCAEDIREVVNITREMTGSTTQRTVSGRAIEARQRSGLTTQEPVLESFQQDRALATQFMVRCIQQYLPIGRALRILGSIAVRHPASAVSQFVTQTPEEELTELLKNAQLTEYDVVIDTDKPWEPTLKLQRWQALKEIVSQFHAPDGGPPIPFEVLVEAARDAGLINEDDAAKTITYLQGLQAQHGPPGLPAGASGAPPLPPIGGAP